MGITRLEMWSAIGAVREIDPLTDDAYAFAEMMEEGKSDQGASVDDLWHVSFHGSSFPGDNPKACARLQLYRMLDTPRGRWSRSLRQVSDAGKDIEDQVVKRWYLNGTLLSTPPWGRQQQFEDPAVWLTSTVDAITLPRRANKGIVAEVKTKYADVIEKMKRLQRGPDPKHVFQLKAQIGLAHEAGPKVVQRCFNSDRMGIDSFLDHHGNVIEADRPFCPQHRHHECLREVEILPPDYGYIYYVSRDNPVDTFEFYYEYDPNFMAEGRAKLAQWRQSFIEDILPQTNFDNKRFAHPFGWKWTEEPCKYCDFGQICRDDMRAAKESGQHVMLSDSVAIDDAKHIRENYSIEAVRTAVFERWNEDPDMIPIPARSSDKRKEAA